MTRPVEMEIYVDSFAGGGGASEGMRLALGRGPDIAINHDAEAIALHEANHPESEHYQEDVLTVDPVKAVRGRDVGWLHLSPDCTHFSRAKGGKPRSKKIRALADVGLKWAEAVRPRILSLENVQEFTSWGPLDDDGNPVRERSGEDFRRYIAALESLGYVVDHNVLVAADFGAPTIRKRLFMVARRDVDAITWPVATHGAGRAHPWRNAASCIDWSIPCPSIFDRAKPLAEATQRRIAEGIRRYVLEAKRPFLVNLTHGVRIEDVDQPFNTITGAHRGEKAVVAPTLVGIDNQSNGGRDTWSAEDPLRTVTMENRFALCAAFLTRFYGTSTGASLDHPAPTVADGHGYGHTGLVAPTLIQMGYGEREGQAPRTLDLHAPLGTIVAGGLKHGLVAAFLAKWYGNDHHGQGVDEPLHTVPTKDRFGLVTVNISGQTYAIVDIGMRMLQPRELARAQGFPDSYVLTGTKTSQVARVGNSVCPDVACALVKANLNQQTRMAA